MPKVNSLQSTHYGPRPQDPKPLRSTPYDQTKARPAKMAGHQGKLGGLGDKTSGGGMNTGGKRRSGKRP